MRRRTDLSWTVHAETTWPVEDDVPRRLALDVDPRKLWVHLGPQVVGSASLDVQSGAIARSFYDGPGTEQASDLTEAVEWLRGPEAAALLDTIEAGFHCEVLWTGDPVASWTEAAWRAGHSLVTQVGARVGQSEPGKVEPTP
ncbi:MAG: hypothetical protein EXR69_15880 [Myxococcales bacterium]|nr:hypothetical protein [Myxococcales bacterium]